MDNLKKDMEDKEVSLKVVIKEKERLEGELAKLGLSNSKAAEMPSKIM